MQLDLDCFLLRRIPEQDAHIAMDVLLSFFDSNIKIYQQDPSLLREAYEKAREYDLAVYDCIYIALAKRLGGSLASRDPRQIEAAKKSRVKITSS